MLSASDNKDTKSRYLETICRQVDYLVRDKSKDHQVIETSIWRTLEEGPRTQELFVKCLVYKLISLSYGLAENALQDSVRLIENATKHPPPVNQQKPRSSTEHVLPESNDPRSRSSAGNMSTELVKRRKSTENKNNLNARKSMAVSNYITTRSGNSKVKKAQTFNDKLTTIQQEKEEAVKKALENKMTRDLLYTLAFTTTIFDPTTWDYHSLREVFLMWNRAREWSGHISKFETSVLKILSICPKFKTDKEKWMWRYEQLLDSMTQNTIHSDGFFDDFAVSNGLKFWPLRENVEKNMPLSLSIELIVDSAEKILKSGERKKLLPILHSFRESMVMAHHVQFQVLQRAYSTFLEFYTWPAVYASAVKDTLDVIQTEMKSPGYFYRVLYIQEHDMHKLFEEASFETTRNVSNMYVDENIECSETLVRICNNMWNCGRPTADTCGSREETYHLLFHIFTSVFGTDECDLDSLSAFLKKCSNSTLSSFCVEALQIMDESAEMDSHELAQPHIRQQLEKLTEKLIEVSEDAEMKMKQQKRNRRFTLIVQPHSSEVLSSPTKETIEPTNWMRRRSQTIEQIVSEIGRSGCNENNSMDFEMSTQEFDFEDFKDEMFGLLRNTAKIYVKEKRKSIVRRRSTLKNVGRDSGVVDDMIVKNNRSIKENESADLLDLPRDHLSSDLHNRSSGRSSVHSDLDDNDTKKYWMTFLNKGFATDDNDHKVLDDLFKSMTLECPHPATSNRGSMEGGRADPPDLQVSFDYISESFVERDRTCSQGSRSSTTGGTKEDRGNGALPKSKRKQFKEYKNRFKTLGKKGLTRMLSSAARKKPGLNSGLEGDTLEDNDFVTDEGNVDSDFLSIHGSPTRDVTRNMDESGMKTWAKFGGKNHRKNGAHVKDIFAAGNNQGPASARSSFSTSSTLKVITGK